MNKYLVRTWQYTYDLVVCAFTLFEFDCADKRLQHVLDLWKKTEKYLVCFLIHNHFHIFFCM